MALLLQVAATRIAWGYAVLLPLSYGLLLVGTLSNLRKWGFRLLLVGLLLNILPLLAHQWYMPVAGNTLIAAGFSHEAGLATGTRLAGSKSILLTKDDTILWFLTDIIPVPWPIRLVLSPGDLIILLALGFMTWDIVRTLAWKQSKGTPWRNKLQS